MVEDKSVYDLNTYTYLNFFCAWGYLIDNFTGADAKFKDNIYVKLEPNSLIDSTNKKIENANFKKMFGVMDSASAKIINIIYGEENTTYPGEEVFLAYYDETLLMKIVHSAKTNQNGVASFIIPSSKNSGSYVFYFSDSRIDFIGNKMAFRIIHGEKAITLKINKEHSVKLLDGDLQVIKFPNDGNKVMDVDFR